MTVQERAHEKAGAKYPYEIEAHEGDIADMQDHATEIMLKRMGYVAGYLATQPQWLPIEQAAKDGTVVIGKFPDNGMNCTDTAWSSRHQCWVSHNYPNQPTHFMPIPALP